MAEYFAAIGDLTAAECREVRESFRKGEAIEVASVLDPEVSLGRVTALVMVGGPTPHLEARIDFVDGYELEDAVGAYFWLYRDENDVMFLGGVSVDTPEDVQACGREMRLLSRAIRDDKTRYLLASKFARAKSKRAPTRALGEQPMNDFSNRLAEALGMSPEDAAAALDAHFDEIAALLSSTDSQAPSAFMRTRTAHHERMLTPVIADPVARTKAARAWAKADLRGRR